MNIEELEEMLSIAYENGNEAEIEELEAQVNDYWMTNEWLYLLMMFYSLKIT